MSPGERRHLVQPQIPPDAAGWQCTCHSYVWVFDDRIELYRCVGKLHTPKDTKQNPGPHEKRFSEVFETDIGSLSATGLMRKHGMPKVDDPVSGHPIEGGLEEVFPEEISRWMPEGIRRYM